MGFDETDQFGRVNAGGRIEGQMLDISHAAQFQGDDDVELVAGPDFQGGFDVQVLLQKLKGGLVLPHVHGYADMVANGLAFTCIYGYSISIFKNIHSLTTSHDYERGLFRAAGVRK